MKNSCLLARILWSVLITLVLVAQSGCVSGGDGLKANAAANGPLNSEATDTTYRAGDKITIDFADNQGVPATWQQVVREDGTITLPLNQSIVAEGKRKGELEQEIRNLYVPRLLRRLTVNVRSEERSYFVRGEVKNPGQKPHTGSITALKAIGAAGDFTDFANKSRVDIIRANGQTIHMNAKKALDDPRKDVPVYPGDIVYVHRRFF